SSLHALLFRLFAVLWDTRNATCGAGPLSGLYNAAATRPKGMNSGWDCAFAAAGKAAAAAMASPNSFNTRSNVITSSLGANGPNACSGQPRTGRRQRVLGIFIVRRPGRKHARSVGFPAATAKRQPELRIRVFWA